MSSFEYIPNYPFVLMDVNCTNYLPSPDRIPSISDHEPLDTFTPAITLDEEAWLEILVTLHQ